MIQAVGSTVLRRRIPCPLDPSHTVFEDVLSKHVKKCNVAKRVLPPCHSPGINEGLAQGPPPGARPPLTLTDCPPEQLEELIQRVEAAYEGTYIYAADLVKHIQLSPRVVVDLAVALRCGCCCHGYVGHVPSIREEFLTHPCMASDLGDPANGASALKHLSQQSSILAHLEGRGLLDTTKVSCFVEFGAGQGKLTHCIHRAIQYSTVSVAMSLTVAHQLAILSCGVYCMYGFVLL